MRPTLRTALRRFFAIDGADPDARGPWRALPRLLPRPVRRVEPHRALARLLGRAVCSALLCDEELIGLGLHQQAAALVVSSMTSPVGLCLRSAEV